MSKLPAKVHATPEVTGPGGCKHESHPHLLLKLLLKCSGIKPPVPKEDSRHFSPAGGSLAAGPRLPGPKGTPCPKPGILISSWPLHTGHKPPSFLCESCPSGSFAFPPPSSRLAQNTAGSFSPPASRELCPLLGLLAGSLSSFMLSLRGTAPPPTTQARMDLYCFLSLSKDYKLSEGKNPV